MSELPGNTAFGPEDRAHDREADPNPDDPDDSGWGSPVPAEYGSLQAMPTRPPDWASSSSPSYLRRVIPAGRQVDLEAKGSSALDQPTEAVQVTPSLTEAPLTESSLAGEAVTNAAGSPRSRRRPGRTRVSIRHVDIKSVAKVSLVFYTIILVVIVVASLLLWVTADAFGTLSSIDKSVRTLFSLKSFKLHPEAVALFSGLAGVVLAVAGTVWNVLLALIYNLIVDVVGGIRVDLESSIQSDPAQSDPAQNDRL